MKKIKNTPATPVIKAVNDGATLSKTAPVTKSPIHYALDFAQKSMPAFPLQVRDKKPMPNSNGFKDATTDETIINTWIAQYPHANIGIATGGWFFVLDIDINHYAGKYGDESLTQLEKDNAKLPDTVEVTTGGGGRHLYFKMPEGVEIPCSAGKLGANLDIRSTGGYVVAPPSIHPNGKAYEFEGSSDLFEGVEIADAPAWLIDLVKRDTRAVLKQKSNGEFYESSEWDCMADSQKADFIAALNHCTNQGYDNWTHRGMEIHSVDPTETGYRLWCEWSAKDYPTKAQADLCADKEEQKRYYDEKQQAIKWCSFSNGKTEKRNKESLFFVARENGYNPEFKTTHYAANSSNTPKSYGKPIKKDGAKQLMILGIGTASCSTIYEAFAEKYPVADCIDNDGLKIVAAHLRELYSKLRMVIAGNSNALDEYDTGRKKAQAACYNKNGLIGGIQFVTPNFKIVTEAEVKAAFDTRPSGTTQSAVFDELKAERLKKYETTKPTPTSFDDLAIWSGIDAVKTQIESVINRMGVIFCEGGEQHNILKQIEAEMNFDADNLFQRAGQLVRTIHIEKEFDQGGVKMPANTLTIHSINEAWLANYWTKITTWKKFDVRSQKYNRVDAPLKYATAYFSQIGDWNLRPLRGIVECPTLRRDGSLLNQIGYDKASGLFVDYSGAKVTVKDNPTRDDALAALQILNQPLKDFKFLSPADRSVILAAMLTTVVRQSVRTAPLFAIDAPVKGSGKSLLADIIAIISTGRNAITLSQGGNPEEDEKKLGALLMRGISSFNLDNIERQITGDFINSLLTAESVSTRILGQSKIVDLQTSITVLATGNNLSFGTDMNRRVALCRLDPQCERPDAITFDVNLREWVPANRHLLLGAILTILRAYIVAGKPSVTDAAWGSFEEWSGLVRSSLVWLGVADPQDTRARLESNDQSKESLNAVLALWFAAFGENGKTAAEIAELCELSQHADLRHVLMDVAGSPRGGNVIDARRLGSWIKKNLNRMIDKLQFEKTGIDPHTKAVFWTVRKTEPENSAEMRNCGEQLQPIWKKCQ